MTEYTIIILISTLFFWRIKDCGLVVDDVNAYPFAQDTKQLYRDKKIPLSNLVWTLLQGAGLFKNIKLDYAFTVLLHTLNACLVLKVSGMFPAALLYLLNPVNNQTAMWLNGRRYAITIFCVLASWAFWPLGLALYPLAVWLHISGVMFPFLFLATPFWALTIFGAAFCYFFGFEKFKKRALGRMQQFNAESELFKINWRKAIFYVKHIGYYFQIILFPLKPRMYHEYHFYFPRYQWAIDKAYKIDLDFLRGAAVLAYLTFEIAVNHNFWAFWFLLFISQYAGIFTTTMTAADRYCSLAGVGLLVLLSQKIALLPEPYATASLWGIVAFYAAIYNPLFWAYQNWERFMLYHTNIAPEGPRQRLHLAQLYLKNKDQFSAFYQLKQGLKQKPHDFDMLYTMANVALLLQSPQNCLNMIKRAEDAIPLHDEVDSKQELGRLRDMANQMLRGVRR